LFRVVIPARFASTRLPGKALLPIGGKPMLQWVYERASSAGATEVLIATDDERIASTAHAFGAEVVMTARTHTSGTDRIAEVARSRNWAGEEIVVNVQGDEPLIPPATIAQVARLLATHPAGDIATLATALESLEELLDPNVVKVVTDVHGVALYFSRAPVPWNCDSAPTGPASPSNFAGARRHRGIYAYRVASLLRFAQLPRGILEQREKLEQLRALEHGLRIHVEEALERPGPDVNTFADLERVRVRIASPGT
jgi:3-deoxy-manno-octulosonate cytidylyltransferase (CMP-KDO synthetase)